MAGARNPWEENYGSNDGQDSGAKPWEQAYQQPEPPKARTWGEAIKDTGAQLAEGVNTTLGAIPSVVAPQSKAAGFFRDNAEHWRDQQSDVLKDRIAASDQRIQEAGKDGVMSQIGTAASEYWNDPAQAARLVATNLPSMAATLGTGAAAGLAAKGVAAARGLDAANKAALAAKYGTTTTAATNAALNAGGARGEAFEDLQKTALAQGMTPEQAEQAGVSGSILPGVAGGVAGAVSGKIGLEKALLGQATTGAAMRKAGGAFGAELAGEQIEELAPKVATNYQVGRIDPGRTLTDDLGRTMVETAIGSGPGAVVAGGAAGMRTGELPSVDLGPVEPTTSPGAADPNAPVPPPVAGPTLALAGPDRGVIQVAGDGTARTPAYQAPGYVGDVTDVEPRAVNPVREQVAAAAEQGGALSSAALTAIDTGLSDAMQPAPEQAPPQISLEEADARDQAAYEQFFANLDAEPVVGRYVENDDDIPDFDAASNVTDEEFLRSLDPTITDQEIQDAIATTRQPAIPQSRPAVDAGAQANEPAGTRQGAGTDQAAQGQVNAGAIQQAAPDAPVPGVGGTVGADGAGSAATAVSGASGAGGAGTGAATGSGAGATEVGSARAGGRGDSNQALNAPTNLRDALERVRQQKQEAANAQAAQAPAAAAAPVPGPAAAPAVEASGVATPESPFPTTGVISESQASQAQQASPQPTQAAAAPAAAAGLTNGTTTPQNLGAQAAPAGGTQGKAQTPDQIRRARLEREISTGKTNNGGVIASLRPSAIEKRKQELDAMGERGRILDAQGKAPRATAEQLTGAQERWQRMTTAERQAVAARTDVKPILRKNLHGAKWENLNVDVQRKLQAAMEPQAVPALATGPVRVGRDNTPLGEGGKPFKTRKAAGDAKKLQPMMRVVTVPGGYALAEKTPAQLAAEERASRRLRNPNTSARGEPIPAHAFIAAAGGLNRVAASDMGADGNPRIGNRTLFAGQGRGLSMDQATQMLIQDGYLSEGATINDALALIKKSLTQPQYNADGIERIAQAEADAQFEDYLAAQEEAAADGDTDPFGMADEFTADELEEVGYTAADPALQAEVSALIAQAEAMGIDTFAILEDIARTYANATQDQYNAAARDALTQAIARSNQDGGSTAAQAAPAAESAADQGLDPTPALELAAQTPAEAEAHQDAQEQAAKAEAAAKRAEDAAAKAEDERKRIAQASVRAADRFELGQDPLDSLTGQGNIFDAPEPEQQAAAIITAKETDKGVAMFSRTGAKSPNAQQPTTRAWYDRFVSLLPASYRNDPHRREPLPAEDWSVQRATEVRGKVESLNKQLRGENDRKGYGPISIDGLGNLQVSALDVSVDDLDGPIKALANELGAGIAVTKVRAAGIQALQRKGFVAEISLAPVADRIMGREFVTPANAYATDAGAQGAIMTYKPRGFPAVLFARDTAIPPADSNARNAATQLLVDGLKAKWTRAPEIIVARNMQDPQVPQAVRDYDETLKSQGATGEARGFIYKGKVYLLSDQLKGPQQIAEVLFHEVLGHYGLGGAFGDSLNSILQQMGTMRRRDVVAKAREYGLFNKDALGGLDKKAASDAQIWAAMSAKDRLSAAEEVLAEMAQTQPTIGFVQRAIAAIRNWLRSNVPGFKILRLTDADIVQAYILPARGFVTRSKETGAQSLRRAMAAFSRDTNGAVTNQNDVVGNQGGRSADDTTPGDLLRKLEGTQVVDPNGAPLLVYHGSKSQIDRFDASKTIDGGLHFGGKSQASMRSSKILHPAYLYAKNLRRSKDTGSNWKAKIASAKAAGYDGIVYLNRYEGVSKETVFRLHSQGLSEKLDRMSDAEFRRAVPEAEDSYIVFDAKQVIQQNESSAPDSGGAAFSRTPGDQTQTEAFKRWFAGSRVVDADGKPLVVYHGTTKDFDAFDQDSVGDNFGRDNDGFFFTGSAVEASGYADPQSELLAAGRPDARRMTPLAQANVMPVYLSIKNPLTLERYTWAIASSPEVEIDESGVSLIDFFDSGNGDVTRYAKEKGHDGVLFQRGGKTLAVAFFPEQIKSATGNSGQFDQSNPDIRFSFAGQQAATADTMALATAQQRLEAGEDAETVRQETGWHKGVDGKWRFEISDADARLKDRTQWTAKIDGINAKRDAALQALWQAKEQRNDFLRARGESPSRISSETKKTPEFKALAKALKNAEAAAEKAQDAAFLARQGDSLITVGDVLSHPALFAAYPGIADVRVDINDSLPAGNAAYAYELRAIELSGKSDAQQLLSTLLHEIQHGIQHIEGFATGGNQDSRADVMQAVSQQRTLWADVYAVRRELDAGKKLDAVLEEWQEFLDAQPSAEALRIAQDPELETSVALQNMETLERQYAQLRNEGRGDTYRRLAGEVEARNTQARQGMTDEQRRATPPSQTADVADSRVIVMFSGKEMANAPMPANAAPDAATTAQPLRTPAATIRAAITKAYGKLLGQLESKGLVTLTQTEDEAIEAAAQARAAKTGQSVEQVRSTLRASVKNSVADQTQTENFKRWFGDSKVVDADGNPLRVYHGTTSADITEFRPAGGRDGEWQQALEHFKKAKANNERYGYMNFRSGTFFSPKSEYAGNYTHENQGVMYPAYIKAENPIYFDQVTGRVSGANPDKTPDALILHINGDINEVSVIDPAQIKSAIGNRGTFDPADPDIRRSADGSIQGFFDPQTGQSFLIADNLTAEAAPGVMMHEVGIHMAADGSMKALFNRAAMMLKLQRGNPFMKAVQDRMDAAGETSGEEAAAYIAEAYENDRANAPASVQRWLADLLAAVKAWMFKKGIMGADRLTVADIAAVARANARSMARDGGATGGQGFGTAFSRAPAGDQTQTEAFKRWFAGSRVVDADGKPLVVYHGTNVGINEFKPAKGLRSAGGLFESSATSPFKFFSPDKEEAQSYANAKGGHRLFSVYLRMERPLDSTTPDGLARMHRLFGSLDDTELSDWADSAVDLLDGIDELRATTPAEKSYFIKRDAKGRVIGQRATEREGYILEKYTAEDHAAEIERDLAQLIVEYEALLSAVPSSDAPLSVWAALDEPDSGDRLRAAGFDGLVFHENDGKKTFAVLDSTQIKSAVGNNGDFDPANPDIRFSRAPVAPAPAAAATSGWDAPVQTGFDDVIYKLQDKNIDLKRVVEAITKSVGQVSDSINAYLKEELFHKRAAKRVADFGAHELKPLMNQMRLAGLSMEDVEEYLHARHAKEANAVIAQRNPGNAGLQDGGSGMTNAAADNYFAKLDPTQRRKLEAVAKSVDAIIEGTRKLYVDYGLEDQAVVDGWANMYQHYIPLMREDKDGGMGTGQGFSVKGKETKGRTGSTRKVVDILANVAMQREKLIVRGEKNIVAQALVGLAQANPNPDFWEVRSEAPTERVFDQRTGVVVERPDPLFKSRENVVVTKVKDANGNVTEQMVVFNEDNPRAVRMAAAMKNLDAGNLEGLLGMSAKITRYFSAINTQYNPVFGVVNLVRDVQGAMVNLAATPLAGQQGKIAKDTVSALRGIYSDIRKTRRGGQATSQWAALWEQMQDDGGTTGYRELFTTSADRANNLKSILNPEAWMDNKWGKFFTANGQLKVPMSIAQKGATEIFGWLSDYNEAMENGVRLAAYKAALDKGMSREQAASLAKNLTVNFNRKGQVGMQAGAVYAFFNAAMQGTARIGQTLFDMDGGDISTLRLSKTGKAVVYGGVTLGVMQALALAGAGFDEEDPPEFVRERSLIIPTGGKTYVSIPMPLGLHVIPGIGRHATEFALSGFDKPAKRALSVIGMFADAFNPIGNAGLSMQTLAPTALDPLVALTENKDWTGKPIARVSSNKAMPGHTQWKDTATGFSKVAAEAINWISGGNEYVAGAFSPTPDQIDYLLAQVGGGVAREAAKVQQTISTAMSGETLPTHKIPLVGRFVGNAASQASQGSAFYANLNKLNALETEIKGLRKDGRFDEAAKLVRENPQATMIAMANRAERDVQKLRRDKRELIAKDASREEVRAKEDQITAVMMRLNEAAERRKAN